MGKSEVIHYLIKQNRPVEMKEMSEHLKINRANISHSCQGLAKENAILINKVKERCFIKYMITINPKYLK